MRSAQDVMSLESKTLAYWKVSSIWNGRRPVSIETGDAIQICSLIVQCTPAQLKQDLLPRTRILLQEIVQGSGTKVDSAKIIPFEIPTKKSKRKAST